MTFPLPALAVEDCPRRATIVAAAVLLMLLLTARAHGLIIVGKGNDPVPDNNWPAGARDVANLRSRVGWWEGPPFGGGQHNFLYRGDTAAFQAALDAFAKVQAPALELFVHAGPHEGFLLKDRADPKSDARIDWSFAIWNPQSWSRLYGNPKSTWNAEDPNFGRPMDAPRVDVYVGGGGGIDWSAVKVPANVTVTDGRASVNGYKDGSALIGNVIDQLTSKPVSGARVAVERSDGQDAASQYVWKLVAEGRSDAAGRFEVRAVPAGNHRVVARADGMATRVLGHITVGTDTFKRYDVRLAEATQVAGTVADANGAPVTGVTVRADAIMGPDGRGYNLPDRPEVATDAAGKFVLAGLPRGHCQLFAYRKGFHALDVLKVYAVPPAADVALRVAATGALKGKVVGPGGAAPAESFTARLIPAGGERIGAWSGSGDIAADGTFAFDDVPPGKYTVSARPNPGPGEDLGDPREVEVRAGETAEVRFERK